MVLMIKLTNTKKTALYVKWEITGTNVLNVKTRTMIGSGWENVGLKMKKENM